MALTRLVRFLKQEVCCLKKKKKKTKCGYIISLTTSQRAKVPFKLLRLEGETPKVGEGRARKRGVYESDGIKRDLTRSY